MSRMHAKLDIIEFHVDSLMDDRYKKLHKYVAETEAKHNGMHANQSVFRNNKEEPFLFVFGQDKVIFKQFLMNKKCWFGPNGEFRVRPKDDGSGLMVSGLQSYEFGFGFPNFKQYKQQINSYRKGKHYYNGDATNLIHKSTKKE